MDSKHKQLRQNFFAGHSGSNVQEVLVVTCTNQLANLLMMALLSLWPALTRPELTKLRYAAEYVVTVLPFLLSVTLMSEHIYLMSLSIIFLTLLVIVLCFVVRQTKPIDVKELLNLEINYKTRLPFLTNLMSTLLLCVFVAILAVDFSLFSRRFAKTEIYGWSLMDVGVGCFIIVNAGFSPESRLGTQSAYKPLMLFRKTLVSTIPLIVFGFQRLIAVKSLDYYEHITEYGLHWNFFFTLAFTKLFSTTFCCLFTDKVNIGLCGIVLALFYQICLSSGLSRFIQNDDRNGLFAANKEGIISLMGYISLYLFFVQIGKYITKARPQIKEWLQISCRMFSITIISGLLMILSHNYIEEVSRREVNLSFVLWMIALNCFFIGLEFIIQTIIHCLQHLNVFESSDAFKSIIFTSIGHSGMLLFLLANLLTGLANFTIDTIAASDWLAFCVLVVYTSILSFVSVLFLKHNVRQKLRELKFPFKSKSD